MSFLKMLAKEKATSSIRELIDLRVGGMEKPRSLKSLHASDLTKDHDFCPREVALMELLGIKRKDSYIATNLRITFDEGRDKQYRLNNDYLRDVMVGHWKCASCGHTVTWSRAPKSTCPEGHPASRYEYAEVAWRHKEHGVTGSTDALLSTGSVKLRMIEVKIMAQDQWVDLAAPLAEHRLRTNLYLRLIAESEQDGWAQEVDTDQATVLYWLRGFGRKTSSGSITPFKEFTVTRDDSQTDYLMARAASFSRYRTLGVIPDPICPTAKCKRAEGCVVVKECFSGKYGMSEAK